MDNDFPNSGGFDQNYGQHYTRQDADSNRSDHRGNFQENGRGSSEGYRKDYSGSGGGNRPFQRRPPTEEELTFYKPYGITGNRDCPAQILEKVDALVRKLEQKGYTVRTGGMNGIEDVAEKAANVKKELHLPFKGFDGKDSKFSYSSDRVIAVARKFQPGYDGLKKGAQTFCNKNVRLVMGKNAESPSLFMVVWTEDGVETARQCTNQTGFTRHSITIASAAGIPVFNLGNPTAEDRLNAYIDSTIYEV